jgi:L-malate glycosyltransferase
MAYKQPIKICFVIDVIESPTAGTEKQLLLLIKNLDRAKFLPCLCVLRSSEWLRTNFNLCTVHEIGMTSFGNISGWLAILRFGQYLKDEKIDIVQTFFRDGGKVGLVAAKLAGVKTIIGSRRNQGFWLTKKELLLQKLMNRWTTRFIANCESTRQWAVRTEDINPNKISVIYNALETNHYYRASNSQRTTFCNELDLPVNAIIIGIVANLRPIKAIDTFIKAASLVACKTSQAYFVIVGDGPERVSLEALCNSLEIQSRVRFLGKRTDIPAILSCLDMGVLSSNSESFSNAILEYMAAGLAVVCTDVGGAREAVEDGLNGYVVEPGNAAQMAEKLLDIIEQEACATMGCQGRGKAIQLFSQTQIFECYQQLYEEVV